MIDPNIVRQGEEFYVNLQLAICDNGVGISQENCKKLFIDFGKLEDTEGRNKTGTGLGLSICKQIIEQMGGQVKVESKLRKGTNFIINIKTKCKAETQIDLENNELFSDIESVSKISEDSQSLNSPDSM